jgi:hypothetical protein
MRLVSYARGMRYPDGGGLDAAERARREKVRLAAADSLHRAPPAPLEASASRPPAASARRHRFALIRDTRNRLAISRSLAPASIISAARPRW